MNLRIIESVSRERLDREIPELYVRVVDPDDDGANITSALGEIRLWLVPPTYANGNTSRTLELIVRVGSPLIRNSGRFKGGLDYTDEVIEALEGFDYDTGKGWSVRRAVYWKRVGQNHWYEIRFESTEEL